MCKTGAPRRKVVIPRSFFASWIKRYIAGSNGKGGRKENKRKKKVNWQGELNTLDGKESRRKG